MESTASYELEEGLIGLDCPKTAVNGVKLQGKGSLCGIDQFGDLFGCSGVSWLWLGCWMGDGRSVDCTPVLRLDSRLGSCGRGDGLHRGKALLV